MSYDMIISRRREAQFFSENGSDVVGKSLPAARHLRWAGAFLVRTAWERRPEGPAYLLSSVKLLYLAGQCVFFSTHFPPSDHRNSEVFPEFLRTDHFCSF